MINLYCFHSPARSSVGFKRAAWSISGNECKESSPNQLDEMSWTALTDGGAKVLCMDNTTKRLLVIRDIKLSSEDENGWYLNFALESDQEDYLALRGVVCRLLSNSEQFYKDFAHLFSVSYVGGEHYELDCQGFVQFVTQIKNDDLSAIIERIPSSTIRQKMTSAIPNTFVIRPRRVLLLVPTVTESYFYAHTKLNPISTTTVCFNEVTWEALLNHTIRPEATNYDRDDRTQKKVSHSFELNEVALAAAAGAILISVVALSVYHNRNNKRER